MEETQLTVEVEGWDSWWEMEFIGKEIENKGKIKLTWDDFPLVAPS